ncbi:MAG: DUF4870 domain-containing protein [Caldilineaceae bacterium]|nr:DUF4870 domain-containing protein [Caldilineaceae bacterium]
MDNEQNKNQEQTQAQSEQEIRTPFEQVVDTARDQASEAADAFRRGEFLRDESIDSSASSDDRLIGLLSYASQVFVPLVMPIIVLLSESSKKHPFQRYHAVQSMALSLVFMAIGLTATVAAIIVQLIPILGFFIGLAIACLTPIGVMMYIIAMLYYGYQAHQGKRFAIPGLTNFLYDQGWLEK